MRSTRGQSTSWSFAEVQRWWIAQARYGTALRHGGGGWGGRWVRRASGVPAEQVAILGRGAGTRGVTTVAVWRCGAGLGAGQTSHEVCWAMGSDWGRGGVRETRMRFFERCHRPPAGDTMRSTRGQSTSGRLSRRCSGGGSHKLGMGPLWGMEGAAGAFGGSGAHLGCRRQVAILGRGAACHGGSLAMCSRSGRGVDAP